MGPGDVPLLCNVKDLACPTSSKAPTARPKQFPQLSNLGRADFTPIINREPADVDRVDGLNFRSTSLCKSNIRPDPP